MNSLITYIQDHIFLSTFLLLLGLYLLIMLLMYKGQRNLLYHPDAEMPSLREYGLAQGTEIVHIPSHDGLSLYGWYRKPDSSDKPFIVLFHGNAGHIGNRAHQLRFFRDQGYGFLIASYRYNAGNAGLPSEENLLRDGQAVLNWAYDKGVKSEQLVLYGESLGSGIAISLAQNNLARAVILEGPYSSVSDVAAARYWFLPVRYLIKDEFDSQSYIGNLLSPVLILHGEKDQTIPVAFAHKLYAGATKSKDRLVLFPEGGHVDLYDHGAGQEILKFLSHNPPLEGL